MTALLRWIGLRHLLHDGPRTLLTLFGVALGVAVFVSIRLANHSALASFAETVDAVAGRANLQVAGGTEGFDERLFATLARVPGVIAAAPVVQVDALAAPRPARSGAALPAGSRGAWTEALMVLGLDPLREGPFAREREWRAAERDSSALAFLVDPRAVAITATLAARHRLGLGDTLEVLVSGRPVGLVVRRIVDAPDLQQAYAGNVVLVDVATAQELFHRLGRLDRVDLLVAPAEAAAIAGRVRALLPPGVEVGPPAARSRQVENMVRSFALNLQALSFIAVFVASFLVFNAVSMAVLRRRREIGILRALGATRAEVTALFLGEGLILGVAGSLAGLGFGTLLARGTLGAVSRTLTDLYLVQHARTLVPDPASYALGFGLGLAVALLAALGPALEAAGVPPARTLREGADVEGRALPAGRFALAGVAVLGAAGLTAWWTVHEGRSWGGFAAAFLVLAGGSLLAPWAAVRLEALAGPPLGRLLGVEAALGARYLREGVGRVSAVIAALMTAVGMLVALTLMVGSFRRTVETWVAQTVRGDLYVEPVGHRVSGSATALPADLVRTIAALPGVAAMDTYRSSRFALDGRLAFAVGIDFAVQRERGALRFERGAARDVLGRCLAHDGVAVTQSFARRFGIRAGDTLELPAPGGRRRVPVEAVLIDYTTDAGAVLMDRGLYARLWGDDRVESFALYLEPGVTPDAMRARVLEAVAGRVVLHVMPNRELRSRVLVVFDQTFQITWALQAIAVLVAVLGVVSALTALILQRSREIGMLRAAGALRSQIRTMVLAESALLGLVGAVLGCAIGLVLALLLVHVINRQYFGWTIEFVLEPGVFGRTLALMLGTALVAGLWPARLAAGRAVAESMRAE